MWQLTFVVVDLLTLKLLIFSLVIAYFGTPRLHQIAPFLSKFFRGSMPPVPPSTSRSVYCYSQPMHLLCFPLLDNKLIFMRKNKNADQIFTYLMKLKFIKCIGPNSNCRQLKCTKNTFTLSIKKLV